MPGHEIDWLFHELKEAMQTYRGKDLEERLKEILTKRLGVARK